MSSSPTTSSRLFVVSSTIDVILQRKTVYSGRVKKVGKLSVARQGLDLLIIVDHGRWMERGGLLHDAINLGKLSTAIVRPACICVLRILLRL